MLLKNTKWITATINSLLVILLVYTGTSKLIDHNLFKEQLARMGYLKSVAAFLSIALPVSEILTGVFIAFKSTTQIGLWSASILMTVFTLYVALMLADNKTKLPCSCGGVIKALSWKNHLWLNTFFMLAAWLNTYLTGIRKRE
ncbi:MauE/DoxX family redox-associated membrane protein [Ferruginibacter sp.]|nr:hypothetical protein [Ferruginibacter sp.]